MANNDKTPGSPATPSEAEAKFSFGVREMREAIRSTELSLDLGPLKVTANENRGFDPYNTSGEFDRTKNWIRVGKR